MSLDRALGSFTWEAAPRWSAWGRRSTRRMRVAAWALGALALVALAWGSWIGWRQWQATEAVRAQVQALRATPGKAMAPRLSAALRPEGRVGGGLMPGQALTTDQRQGLRAVARQLNIPWQELFEQLERSTPPQVALVSVEPDGQRGTVRLQAEAKSLDTLLQYAAALQGQGVLGRLNYNKHETNGQDANRPMRLTVELVLLPSRQAATAASLQESAR